MQYKIFLLYRCKLVFKLPPKQNFEIDSIYEFMVWGDYSKGCENGDYVQFTINGKKSKKFCGKGTKLSDKWCWEDYCWPNTFEVVGSLTEPMVVEAVFKAGPDQKTGREKRRWYGFEIEISADRPWRKDEPPFRGDNEQPPMPMIEQ